MKTPTQILIEDGIKGGCVLENIRWNGGLLYENKLSARGSITFAEILLDPDFWRAVGKTRGLNDTVCKHCGVCWRKKEKCTVYDKVGGVTKWHIYQMHRMIDALISGKSIDQFIETLKETTSPYPIELEDKPMGVSQWEEIGKKYGYWDYFKKKK